MKYYTKNGEWIDVEGSHGRVGISEERTGDMGEVNFVELPSPGAELAAGDTICAVESVKAAVDFFAPLSGRVVEVNENLRGAPYLLGEKHEESWIAVLELNEPGAAAELMDEAAYRAWVAES